MVDGGKVSQIPATVVYGEGNQAQKTVTQIGEFNTVSEGKYLTFVPETGKFEQLSRQPENAVLEPVAKFEQGGGGVKPIFIDPSRGVILSLLVQSPTLKERIDQGGSVGYVILALGSSVPCWPCSAVPVSRSSAVHAQAAEIRSDHQGQSHRRDAGAYQDPIAVTTSRILESKLDEIILRNVPKLEKGISLIKLIASGRPAAGPAGYRGRDDCHLPGHHPVRYRRSQADGGRYLRGLVTTMQGLVVAVPMLFLYTIVQTQSRRLIQVLEEQSAGFVARYQERLHAAKAAA